MDFKDRNDQTPLSYAAAYGDKVVVEVLLKTGEVDVDSKSPNGRRPLSYAAKKGYEAVLKLLLETRKADVNSKGNSD